MDESSLGILLPEDMNLDSFGTSVNEDTYPGSGRRESRSQREEFQNQQQADVDLLSSLNCEFNDDGDDEIDFRELGLDEEDLAMLEGNISGLDSEDSDSNDDDKEELFTNDNKIGMTILANQLVDPTTSNIGFQAGKGFQFAGSSSSSSDVDTDTELQAIYRQNRSRFSAKRPDLEGNSMIASTIANSELPPRLDLRESAEGSVVSSPVNGNGSDGGGGDGSSGHSDDGLALNILTPRNSEFTLQSGERICPQGIENNESLLPQIFFQPTQNRPSESYFMVPWGDESSLHVENFQSRSRELNCRADGSDTAESRPVIFSTEQISARSSSLPNTTSANTATYSSINSNTTLKATSVATAASTSKETQNWMNLENKSPTTDLAVYTDLPNEYGMQDFVRDGEINLGGVNEGFVCATDAMDMLNRDEKEFQENPFQQDATNSFSTSMNWMNKDSLDITRPSWMSDVSHDRVSIGKFLSSKTNPLGSLGNKNASERPAFGGNAIVSPRNSILYEDNSPISGKGEANKNQDDSSIISISFIEKFIQEASMSADSNTLADQVFKLAKQMKIQKKQTLKNLEELSIAGSKIDRRSGRKRTSFDVASTSKAHVDNLDLMQYWEPVRPSSAFQSRPSVFQSPIVPPDKPRHSVGFEERFKKPCDLETPSVLIHQEKKFPTSTPYCGNFSFPINLSDSSWPSQIAANDPTPKSRYDRIQPRSILPINENPTSGAQTVENFEEHNVDFDADKTLTETNAFEIRRRLSGGQDTRFKNKEKLVVVMPPEQNRAKKNQNSTQQVNLFNYKLGNQSCDRSTEFFPLTHNTVCEGDQSSARTPESSRNKQSFVQLPFLKKNSTVDSYQGLGTSTQFRDCDTVSLQRTSSIRVPPELKFDEVACVGIGCEAFLPIQNLTSRWLKCNFQLVNLVLDSQSLPTEISPFIFKHETIIEPNSIDKFQIMYASRVPGAVRAELQVTAQPIVPNKPGQNNLCVSQVSLMAEAEHPSIDVLLDEKHLVDFGTLAEDSCTEINFGLVNVGPASVPIRLVIQSSNKPWQGFYFSKKNLNGESPTLRSLRSSNVISFKIPGQSVGTNTPKVFNTLLAFRAPTLDASARNSVVPMSATLNVEVDIPGNTVVLHTIPLTARIGTVHLETLKDLEPVKLQSTGGKPAICKIPLRNSGSIPLILEATILHSPRLFVITPHSLQIPPGQESDITMRFIPQAGVQKISSVLLLTLYPGGPAYEIQLTAEVMTSTCGLNLESSKHFLTWGGVPLGSSQDQTLILRNSYQLREPCEIQVSIRGATEDYWLMTSNGAAQSVKYTIVSQEEIPICVKFAPTCAKHLAGKVIIKPTSLPSNSKQIRFVIPLVGYGGKSKLELIGLQQDERGVYIAPIEQLGSAPSALYTLSVKNVGEWAAFVKIIPSSEDNDDNRPSLLQSNGKAPDFLVSPNEFVVGEQKSVKISIVIRLSEKSFASPNIGHNSCIGAMTILYGDEISRKRFRALKSQSSEYTNNSHQTINFDVTYRGEDIANDEDMPSTPNDVQLFYNGITHCQLQLVSVSDRRTNVESWMVDSRPAVTASPPVRELQMTTPRRHTKCWEILPKRIVFNVGKSDGKSYLVQSVQLQNKSNRPLKFYFVWPGYLFNINPANGVLRPKEQLKVAVTIIPSELSEWEGNITAKCDELQEEIKVEVRCTDAPPTLPSEMLSPVKILVKKILFPATFINCSSEFSMEMKNSQVSAQQWILSSVNPAVVKTKTGEMRKVGYSVFRFTKMSGNLRADEISLIPVTFLPLDEGNFEQEWELVTKDSAKNVHRVTLKLIGQGINKSVASCLIPTTKKPTRSQSLTAYPQKRDVIQLSTNVLEFGSISVHKFDKLTVQISNISQDEHLCRIIPPEPPFFVNHSRLCIKRRRFIKLPISFKPTEVGEFKDVLKLETDINEMFIVHLSGVSTRE